MKTLALVAAHFPPSNLAAVHRARLWAQHLQEFGWTPVIVTTHWKYYEEKPDWDLCHLLSKDVEIIRTAALPYKPIRLIGDVGIRALPWHYNALVNLAKSRTLDFVHITIPSNFSALLGRLVLGRVGVPYGIDYIDPWVHEWPGSERRFSKAWTAYQLGKLLEPWATAKASLITGISAAYCEGLFARNPELRARVATAYMPYGVSLADHDWVRENPKPTWLFDRADGRRHLVYAGAMLPKASLILERLCQALALIDKEVGSQRHRFIVHFIGTGKSPNDRAGHNIRPIAERYGVSHLIDEHPDRIGYVDVLNHLHASHGVLVVGSIEPHYSPSKVFQAICSQRPIFAMLHERSEAAEILRSSLAGAPFTFTENSLPDPLKLASAVTTFLESLDRPGNVGRETIAQYSAREMARRLALALSEATSAERLE